MKLRTKLLIGSTILLGIFLALQFPYSKLIGKRQTISKSTTRLIEPLRKDGSIDYMAALNEFLSDGVTPDNNALIRLAAVIRIEGLDDSEALGKQYKSKFFEQLGVQRISPAGYLLEPLPYLEENHPTDAEGNMARRDQLGELVKTPWSTRSNPLWSEWVNNSHLPLNALVEASQQPRYFHPLVTNGDFPQGTLMEALLPASQKLRTAARALCLRAMYYVGNRQLDKAIADLKATRRLGQLSTQSVTLVELLIGCAIHNMAADCEYHLLQHPQMTREQLADYQQFLAGIRTHVPIQTRVDMGERFMCLDIMQAANIHEIWPGHAFGFYDNHSTVLITTLMYFVDWNESMRLANTTYDDIVQKLSAEKDSDKIANLADYDQKLERWEKEIFEPAGAISLMGGPKMRGRWMGKMLAIMLLPALSQVVEAETESRVRTDLVITGLALEAFRREHGQFPDDLSLLQPDFVKSVARDRFNDQPLQYQATNSGYLVYSVGRDQTDNGGRSKEELNNQAGSSKQGYDIRIKIELK